MVNLSSQGESLPLMVMVIIILVSLLRYGDEEHLVTLMGVMQTLVSLAELTESDELHYLKAGPSRVVFFHRGPLIFVIVSYDNEPYFTLIEELLYVYHQIISTLTLPRIKQRFVVQPNFDLRRWFSHAEKKLIHNLLNLYENDLGLVMKSARCLIMSQQIRNQIGLNVIQVIRGQKDLLFALILTRTSLVSIARLKHYHLHPSDLYLIINLVDSSGVFPESESWIPVCLPRFDPA